MENLKQEKWTAQINKDYIRKYWQDVVLIGIFFISSFMMELLNRPFGTVHDLTLPIDAAIPLVPATILIYHSWMPFIILISFYYFSCIRGCKRPFFYLFD